MGYVDFTRQTVRFLADGKIFFACCPDCGRLVDAASLHILSERMRRSSSRMAAWLRRQNTIHDGNWTIRMSRKFNRCSVCGKWVCDDCFISNAGYGVCRNCMNKEVI